MIPLGCLVGGASAAAGDFESIATVTLSSAASTITLSSIPSTYQHLHIRLIARDTYSSGEENLSYWLNGDTNGLNYRQHSLTGFGTSAGAGNFQAATQAILLSAIPASTAGANIFGAIVVDILDYANTSKTTTVRAFGGNDQNGAGRVAVTSSLWNSTAAVSSFTLKSWGGNLAAETTLALYGVKA